MGEQGKVKGLQALQGADAAGWEKKVRMVEDALAAERAKSFEVKSKLEGEKSTFGRDILRLQDLLERERQRVAELEDRLESERKLELDRKNFDKLKLDFEARIDTFRNRNTDIEDELRREIATLQKLIETLREQVTFERKRREVHDVNTASKATTAMVSTAMSKGADRFSTSMAGMSKHL